MKERVLIMGEAILDNAILVLKTDNFEVEVVPDYPHGLTRLDETPPDLVIIDERLAVVNGWEACSRLRKITDVPIILLGGERGGRAVARAIDKGADVSLAKPCDPNELKARVGALCRRYQRKT